MNRLHADMSVESFLHSKGYNFFTIPNLTYKEIQQLLDGEKLISGKWDEV
jgi:hypothetical protein